MQGVWYRASAREQALRLNIDGWAKNLDDGRVEVVAAGPRAVIAEFCGALCRGSPASRVAGLSVEEWLEPVAAGFEIH